MEFVCASRTGKLRGRSGKRGDKVVFPSANAALCAICAVSAGRKILEGDFFNICEKCFKVGGGFCIQADKRRNHTETRSVEESLVICVNVGSRGTRLHCFYMDIAIEATNQMIGILGASGGNWKAARSVKVGSGV